MVLIYNKNSIPVYGGHINMNDNTAKYIERLIQIFDEWDFNDFSWTQYLQGYEMPTYLKDKISPDYYDYLERLPSQIDHTNIKQLRENLLINWIYWSGDYDI